MATFYLKKRDTRPILEVALKNPDGTAYDLTGYTATLHVSKSDGTVVTRAMVVDAAPTTGIVRYTWVADDWVTAPAITTGVHRMEYEVRAGLARLTFPNDGYDTLEVTEDLGQVA